MKVLLTGSFGNIGTSTLAQLLARGHDVRCFDLKTKRNEKSARKFAHPAGHGGRMELFWGDLRKPEEVREAVRGVDAVVHTAAVIPRLSATGVNSEEHPDWAAAVNVGGTRNLIEAMEELQAPPRLVYTSSLHVYGRTQQREPPLTVADEVHPVEHYARHKVECERMIKASRLEWVILRLAAAMPVRLILDPGLFDVPLNNRIEYVHSKDVGLAIANALECPEARGQLLLIGGGPSCQLIYGEIVERVLGAVGVGMLPREAFSTTPFAVDWLDTHESQRLLHYQTRTLDDYIEDTKCALGYTRYIIRAFRPLVRLLLLRKSPYLRRKKGAQKSPADGLGVSQGVQGYSPAAEAEDEGRRDGVGGVPKTPSISHSHSGSST